jgi:hypothetical protein
LVALFAVVWGATYTVTKHEEESAIESIALRSDRLANFFESHATATFRYADEYIKVLRKACGPNKDLASVREYLAKIPPSTAILSHIAIMNANWRPSANF